MEAFGIVEVVKVNQVNTRNGVKNSYNILLDGVWYNSFKDFGVKKADRVVIVYTENGKYKNIDSVNIDTQAPQANVVNNNIVVDTQTAIIRQNCLQHATRLIVSKPYEGTDEEVANKIINVAKQLEAYVKS